LSYFDRSRDFNATLSGRCSISKEVISRLIERGVPQ
jgi:hypothetical protein